MTKSNRKVLRKVRVQKTWQERKIEQDVLKLVQVRKKAKKLKRTMWQSVS